MTNVPIIFENVLAKELFELDRRARSVPDFQPGDTIRVNLKVTTDGQVSEFIVEGVCDARFGEGIKDSFTIHETSNSDDGFVFPIYSPVLDSIEVVRPAQIRSKLKKYLRGRIAAIREGRRVDFPTSVGRSGENTLKHELVSFPKTKVGEDIDRGKNEKDEIIGIVTGWAGSTAQAESWYRGQPIAAFGGQTAEGLVKVGKADVVRHYLNSLAAGGFA